MTKRKKQFIAGAVCPQCSTMDSLVLYADEQSISCIECNFSQSSIQRDSDFNLDTAPSPNKKNDSSKYTQQITITNLND